MLGWVVWSVVVSFVCGADIPDIDARFNCTHSMLGDCPSYVINILLFAIFICEGMCCLRFTVAIRMSLETLYL